MYVTNTYNHPHDLTKTLNTYMYVTNTYNHPHDLTKTRNSEGGAAPLPNLPPAIAPAEPALERV